MKFKSVLVSLDPLSLPRLEAILAYAREHRWTIILEDRLPDGGLDRIDGAIVSLRGRKSQLDKVLTLQQRDKPVVDLTIAHPEIRLPRVISDHRALGALGAQHYLERGFTNFAWYATGKSQVHDLRRQGYAATIKKAGFTLSNLSNLSNLSLLPHPLAILSFDELDAARVIAAALALGIDVPGDIAVLGIGNDPFLCENGPVAISSIDQNLGLAAHKACALLDRLMDSGKMTAKTTLVPPGGVIPRASTETLAHPDPTIRAALVHIHRNLAKPLGAAQIAEAIGIARSTLDHLFTEKIGHSIGTEIQRQRLHRAKRLLKDSSVPLRTIAAVCGFCNASYFTNVFRRATGASPKLWRKRHRLEASSTANRAP